MSIIKTNDINFNSLLFFYEVYQCKSMTKAAEKLHATQSGVSQRIAKLEAELKVELFERVNGPLIPTESAEILYKALVKSFFELNSVLNKIDHRNERVAGVIKIGIPIEFGNRHVLPFIAEFSKKYPEVRFEIKYGHAIHFKESLLNQKLDLAVVDEFQFGNQFIKKKLAKETLTLCAHKKFKISPSQQKIETLLSLPMIDYDEGAILLRQWYKYHFKAKVLRFSLCASAMDVQGLTNLISLGMGIGILPIERAIEKDLFIFREDKPHLINHISVVSLKKNHSFLVKLFFESLLSSIADAST
jgi:DNA-binding transcriptional LysR family regulator